jgi:uncharacterized membrane protein
MRAKARLFGHPIHQMLIVFPLGLLATSLVFDIVHLATGNPYWAGISYWMIAAGIIGGLLAAVFGAIDWWNITSGTRAKRIGMFHGLGNVAVVGLFIASLALRHFGGMYDVGPVVLSIVGVSLALVTGWLGGELVDRLGVGVDEGAHVNAPSSLRSQTAGELERSRVLRDPL